MTPVTFKCEAVLPHTGDAIAAQILDVAKWSEFPGCWPLPGIQSAEFQLRTPGIVGSQIKVVNRDGSTHIEEIVAWDPPRHLQLVMSGFSKPLSRLACQFVETWHFEPLADSPEPNSPPPTRVRRSFELHSTAPLAKIPLRLIAILLKRAVMRHLTLMQDS